MTTDRTILILAPHQDDEIILCGAFLQSLVELQYKVYVVFMTNGDYEKNIGKIRLKEALSVLISYGILEKNIIFMGYANEYASNGFHIYDAHNGMVVSSQYGNKETYGLIEHPEYCFGKHGIHHTYCRPNLVQDLYEIINFIKPDIFFVTDIEVHPDHKANSLFFDEVMGKILQENDKYTPIILKKPGYRTSWFNPKDYSKVNNASSVLNSKVKVNEEQSEFSNPYIRWNNRTRLPIDLSVQNPLLEYNTLWNSLNKYKSQNAAQHYEQMLNSDTVFWTRRTDSISYHANITVSSGNGKYINDFKIIDTKDISRKKQDVLQVGESCWRPDTTDMHATIKMKWKEKKNISTIVIYQDFCPKSQILNCHIEYGENGYINVGRLEKRKPTIIHTDLSEQYEIKFCIDECSNADMAPGITEIEVYEDKDIKKSYMKIMIDDNFVYQYLMNPLKREKLSIHLIDEIGMAEDAGLDSVNVIVTDLYGKILKKENFIDSHGALKMISPQNIRIITSLKSQPEIKDTILVFNDSKSEQEFWTLVGMLQKLGIELNEIDKMNKSVGFEKLSYIQKFYRVAYIHKNTQLCVKLKLVYLRYGLNCIHKKMLTNKQEIDIKYFMLTNEYIPNLGQYIRQYYNGIDIKNVCNQKKKKIYLIGTPNHYNIGDHIISFATEDFIQKHYPNTSIVEVTMKDFPRTLASLKKKANKKDLLVLQGGGNMGNVYWKNEKIRRQILRYFPDNPIIIFPETIFYESTVYGKAEMKESVHIYNKARNLTICAREKISYSIMQKLYPKANIILVPDIVCSYQFKKQSCARTETKLFFRSDEERCNDDKMKKEIEKILESRKDSFSYSDMIYHSQGYIGKANRKYIVQDKVREISNAKLVITDRLHTMILCVLTETPCIVFCGYNYKIRSSYETWFQDVPFVKLENKIENLENDMDKLQLIEKEDFSMKLRTEFYELDKVMKEALR